MLTFFSKELFRKNKYVLLGLLFSVLYCLMIFAGLPIFNKWILPRFGIIYGEFFSSTAIGVIAIFLFSLHIQRANNKKAELEEGIHRERNNAGNAGRGKANCELEKLRAELRESEEKFRDLFNNMSEGVALHKIILDAAGKPVNYEIVDVNPGFTKITGLDRGEVVGKTGEAIYGTTPAPYLKLYGKVASTGRPEVFQEFFDPMGKAFQISVFSPRPGMFATVFSDITELKEHEKGLKRSEKRYRTIFNSTQEAITVVSLDGKFIDVNRIYCEWLGLSKEEVLKMSPADVDTPENAGRLKDRIAEIVEEGELEFETANNTKDGAVIPIEVNARLIEYEGRPAILSVGRDIRPRKDMERTQKALVDSEEKFARFIATTQEGVWGMDEESNTNFVNKKMADILGYAVEEMMNRPIQIFMAEEEFEDSQKQFDMGREGFSGTYERRFKRKNGSIVTMLVNVTPVLGKGGEFKGSFAMLVDITDRKKAEKELKDKTEEMEQFFVLNLDLLCIADTKGSFRRLNPEWEKTLGYSIEELKGKKFQEFVHPEDMESTVNALRQMYEGDRVRGFANRYRTKNGEYKWIEWRSSVHGEAIYAAARDITEQRKREDDLRSAAQETLNHQTALLELAKLDKTDLDRAIKSITSIAANTLEVERVSVWLYRNDGIDLACEDLYVRSRARHEREDKIPVKDYPGYFKHLEQGRTIAIEDTNSDERVLELRDRYYRPQNIVSALDVPIWRSGKMVGVLCNEAVGGLKKWTEYERDFATAVSDMVSMTLEAAERAASEEQLRDSERRLQDIISFLPDATFAIDKAGKVIAWNKAMEEMSGVKSVDMIGKADHEYTIPFYGERRYALLDILLHKDEEWAKKYRVLNEDQNSIVAEAYAPFTAVKGGIHMWIKATLLYDTDGNVTGAIESIRDITERKKMEEEAVAKNKEMESFVYTVSHDLKSPLVSFQGFLEYLMEDNKNTFSEKSRHSMQRLFANVVIMDRLIRDLLELSRVGMRTAEKELISTRELYEEVMVRLADKIAGKDAEIRFEGEDIKFLADKTQITQALINLVSNSIKFLRDSVHGEITISFSITPAKDLRISVKDNGIGIESKYHEKVFDIFYRYDGGKKNMEGSGVGLSIVKKIVERHKGIIFVESVLGEGSEFVMELPLDSPVNPVT